MSSTDIVFVEWGRRIAAGFLGLAVVLLVGIAIDTKYAVMMVVSAMNFMAAIAILYQRWRLKRSRPKLYWKDSLCVASI